MVKDVLFDTSVWWKGGEYDEYDALKCKWNSAINRISCACFRETKYCRLFKQKENTDPWSECCSFRWVGRKSLVSPSKLKIVSRKLNTMPLQILFLLQNLLVSIRIKTVYQSVLVEMSFFWSYLSNVMF